MMMPLLTKVHIALLSINGFLFQFALSIPINGTRYEIQRSPRVLPLVPRFPDFLQHRGHATDRSESIPSLRESFETFDDNSASLRRRNPIPDEYAGWDLWETYWKEASKEENLYRPSVPQDTPTGKQVALTETDRDDLDELNAEAEQKGERWSLDGGSLKKYQFDRKDAQSEVRSVITAPVISGGGYGTIYGGLLGVNGVIIAQLAVKAAKDPLYGGALMTGAGLQKKAAQRSTHVLPVEGYFWDPSTGASFLLMPFKTKGELADYFQTYRRQDRKTGKKNALNAAFLQVVEGLKALHELGIMHRDLKPENILVDDDGTLLISDFDAATTQRTSTQWLVGTVGFLAPEVFRLRPYDKSYDVFSVGMAWLSSAFPKLWKRTVFKEFWKALMRPRNGHEWLTPQDVIEVIDSFNIQYRCFDDMDDDMKTLASQLLCGPDDRIDAAAFYTGLEKLIA